MDETTEPTPAPDAPVETPAWVEILAHWRETIPVFQKCLPLSLKSREQMAQAGLLNSEDANHAVRQHVRSDEYLKNVLAYDHRYNLDGTQDAAIDYWNKKLAGQILKGEIDRFGRVKFAKKNKTESSQNQPKNSLPQLTMQAKHIKLTFAVTDFEKHLDVDTIGKSTVPVLFETLGGKLKANLNPKSFRKAQATYREHEGNVAVVVSGELDLGKQEITGAGIMVQVREKKAHTEPAPAVAKEAPAAPVAVVAPAKAIATTKTPTPAKTPTKTPDPVKTPPTTATLVVVKKKRVVPPAV